MLFPRRVQWRVLVGLGALSLGCSNDGTVLKTEHNGDPGRNDGGATRAPAPDGGPGTDASGASPVGASSSGTDGAASSGNDPDGATNLGLTPASGSRVGVQGWTSGGDVVARAGNIDMQHDPPCDIKTADDGAVRCVPSTTLDAGGLASTLDVLFQDPACTEPVIDVVDCSTPPTFPTYFTYTDGNTCSQTVHVLKVGAKITPSVLYTSNSGVGGCAVVAPAPASTYYTTTPVPASEWVTYTRTVTQVADGLGVEVFTGDDGSRIQGGLRLLPADVGCSPVAANSTGPDTSKPNYCVPVDLASEIGFFADANCTIGLSSGGGCNLPVIGIHIDSSTTCDPKGEYFDLGKQVASGDLYSTFAGVSAGMCSPAPQTTTIGPSSTYYEIGPQIDVTHYPVLEAKPFGTGPVQELYWTAGGHVLMSAGAAETASMDPCQVVTLATGKTLCGASLGLLDLDVLTAIQYFSDDKCTDQLYAVATPAACNIPTPEPKWVERVNSGCGSEAVDVRPVVGAFMGQPYYLNGSIGKAVCTPVAASVPIAATAPKSVYYELGDPIDPSTVFPEVTATNL